MAVSPVLVIKLVGDSTVGVRARLYDDFVEHEIVLNSVIAYWWANNQAPAEKFLELFDSVIKRTINELMPHKILNLKYEVKANSTLDKASEVEINLISIDADGTSFKIEGNQFNLKGLSKSLSSDDFKEFRVTYDRCIETPDIVLKKYMEMQEK